MIADTVSWVCATTSPYMHARCGMAGCACPHHVAALGDALGRAMGGVPGMTEEEWHAQQLEAHQRDIAWTGVPHDHDCAAVVAAADWTGKHDRQPS